MQEKFDHKIKELFADERIEHSEAPVMLQNVFDALEKKKKRRGIIWFWLIPGFACTIFIAGAFIISSYPGKTKIPVITQRNSFSTMAGSLVQDHLHKTESSQRKQITISSTGSGRTGIITGPEFHKKERPYHEHGLSSHTKKVIIHDIPTNHLFIENVNKINTDTVVLGDTNVVSTEKNRNADQPVISSDSLIEQSIVLREFPVDSELTTLEKPVKQRAKVEYFLGFYGSLHFYSLTPVAPNISKIEGVDKEFIDKLKGDNFFRQAFDVGLSFRLKKKYFVFETGVSYMRHDFRIDMNNSPFYSNEPQKQEGAYEFLEIPLFFGAQWNFGKWYISPCIGFTSGWMFISENYVYQQGQYELTYEPYTKNGPVVFSPQIKFDAGYTFDQGFAVSISPFFKHHLSGEAAYSIPSLTLFSYSFGLRLGFNFNIPRREK